MGDFEWKIDQLDESILKDMLIAENNNKLIDKDKFKNKYIDFPSFKKQYYNDIKTMVRQCPDLYFYLMDFIKKCQYSLLFCIIFPKVNINEKILVNGMKSFFEDLDDPDFLSCSKLILNPQNGILKIGDYDEKSEIGRSFQGRRFTYNDLIYGSFYMNHTMEDLPILGHELGHMISDLLYKKEKKKKNPFFDSYFSEFESRAMELFIDEFLGKDIPSYKESLINNHLGKTISNIYSIKILKTMYHKWGKNINIEYLKKKHSNIEFSDDINEYLQMNFYVEMKYLLSSLLSYYVYFIFKEDKKDGLDIYKRLITSRQHSIDDIFLEYGITYEDLTSSLDKLLILNQKHIKRD